jgi:thiamine biosynthesis lipoprotein ApbE
LTVTWGIGGDNPRVPSQVEIDAVLPLINRRDIELNGSIYCEPAIISVSLILPGWIIITILLEGAWIRSG